MKKSTIKQGINPKEKKVFRTPPSWVKTRQEFYNACRIAQYTKMRDRVPTDTEQDIMKRKAAIIARHEVI